MFCHGLFGQGRNWTAIGKALAEDHRVVLVDMPDHGRSAWSERFDYLAAADQVAGLLEAGADGDDDPVALVGHSMGGKIAMLVALRHPALVERLVVVDVAPVPYDHASEFDGYITAMLALDLAALDNRGAADAALTEAVPDPSVRGFLLQNLRHEAGGWRWQPNLAVLGRDLDAITGWPVEALTGPLSTVAPYPGPVLWVGGGDSHYVREEYAAAMGALFPHHRRVTIKGAGHWVHSQQPAVFTEVLRRFLARAAVE